MNPYIKHYTNENIKTNVARDITEHNNLISDLGLKLNTNLKIFQTNIRSLQKNFDELLLLLDQFKENFDIIVLTETFEIQDLALFKINGYNILYNEGNVNKNDGVVVLIKEYLSYQHKVYKLKNIKYNTNVIDLNLLEIEISINSRNVLLTCVYRSPNTCPNNFNKELSNYLKGIKKYYAHILTGDININILSDEDYCQEYLNILNEHDFRSYINKYTRVQNEQESVIDHFFIKCTDQEKHFVPIIMQTPITDHYPILLYLDTNNNIKSTTKKNYATKKYIDYVKLKRDLENEQWAELFQMEDLNLQWELFINQLSYYIDKNTKCIKTVNNTQGKKEWITAGLLQSVKEKNYLYYKMKQNPENRELVDQYKKYKNKLTQLIKNAKMHYYNTIITKNQNCSKKIWDAVNKICNKSNSETIIKEIESNNQIIKNEKYIADLFNKHYIDMGETLANQIQNIGQHIDNEKYLENSIYLHPTNETELKEFTNSLKEKKAPGYDNIKAETLKQTFNEISKPLIYLINNSLEQGIFPDVLKVGVIKPLYKNGDKLKLINYRPITLISNVAKLFEKIIKYRIMKFLHKFNVISNRQFGFREKKSTEDAIAYLTSLIYKKLDENKPSLCIFVDLAKAFDTVCHKRLLSKMKNLGFRGNAFQLITSYLTGRTQYVKINDAVSDKKIIKWGVPQGTVLGPVLFIIYINSLLTLNSAGEILSFADDTAVFYSADTWQNLKQIVVDDFTNIKNWFDSNMLTINSMKTKYLPFTSLANNLPNFGPMNITATLIIEEAHSMKYLGIVIDKHLRWDLQVKNVTKKIRGLLSRFKYLKQYLGINQLKTIYFALIQSHLSYGIIGWGAVANCYLYKLNVLQKWFLKIILNKTYTYSSDSLFQEMNVMGVRQLYGCSILINLQKTKNIDFKNHDYDTRSKNIITKKPKVHKTVGIKNHTYLSAKLYDYLPDEIKDLKNLLLFKKKVKKWILEFPRDKINNILQGNF